MPPPDMSQGGPQILFGNPQAKLTALTPAVELSSVVRQFPLLKWVGRHAAFRHLLPFLAHRYRMQIVQIGTLKTPQRRPVLAGIVTVRVLVYTAKKITSATVTIDDDEQVLARTAPSFVERYKGVGVWAVNLWLDSARIPEGTHKLRVHAYSGETRVARLRRFVVRAPQAPILQAAAQDIALSDAFVPSGPDSSGDAVADVLRRPVTVHRPRQHIFAGGIDSLLVLRTDQLGDVSASLAAMARLRGLFPHARITVLTQPLVQAVIERAGLADEVLTVSFDYSPITEARSLSAEAQQQLRAQLVGRRFDLAIDLAPGGESRPIMLLCDAHYRVGFKPEQFDFLDFGIEVISRDKISGKPILSHAAQVMMLVGALESAMQQTQPVVPRRAVTDDDDRLLAGHGVARGQYIVVHTGARHEINKWPLAHFIELSGRLIGMLDMPVLLFVDAPPEAVLVQRCRELRRLTVLQRVAPDAFDALVAHAHLLVGNDTGPKHLASAHGVDVVSISIPRLSWREWGQNRGGVIVTRQVPCAGCGLNEVSQCGLDAICIRSITVDNVLAAMSEGAPTYGLSADDPAISPSAPHAASSARRSRITGNTS